LKSGVIAAGESVFNGFASGIAGLVKKPYEEGKKTGALGFVKGVGLGLAGVVAKPVAGITDGISTVTQSITNKFNNESSSGGRGAAGGEDSAGGLDPNRNSSSSSSTSTSSSSASSSSHDRSIQYRPRRALERMFDNEGGIIIQIF